MSLSIFTIGRDRTCNFVIRDESVSRIHAELSVVGNSLLLTDLKSSNGTFVMREGRSERVLRTNVWPHDEVRFGATVIRVADILDYLSRETGESLEVTGSSPPTVVLGGSMVCACGDTRYLASPCPLCGMP